MCRYTIDNQPRLDLVEFLIMLSKVIPSMQHVTRHTSHVTRHTSHVTRHTSHVTHHTSYVTRHTSHVTSHTSHVTRHTPRVLQLVAQRTVDVEVSEEDMRKAFDKVRAW